MTTRRMSLSERLLLKLARPEGREGGQQTAEEWTLESALDLLEKEFPGFSALVRDKSVLDYGCGGGWQAAAIARAGARAVVGIDTSKRALARARERIAALALAARVELREALGPRDHGRFDLVISQNSFEHIDAPEQTIEQMLSALKPDGRLFITFGPPWYAPYGAHTRHFHPLPWLHLLFSEETVLAVRARFRQDGARRYEEVDGGLNRMSLGRFEALLRAKGLRVEHRRYRCVKGLDLLSQVPLLREALVNHISVVVADGRPRPRLALIHGAPEAGRAEEREADLVAAEAVNT